MRRISVLFGYLWALPMTATGVLLALMAAASGGSMRVHAGILEAEGGFLHSLLRGSWLRHGGAAMTLGHVILARDAACLAKSRTHELKHVRQFERWGPFLLPVYWLVACWLSCRGFHSYLDHPFEQQASGDGDFPCR